MKTIKLIITLLLLGVLSTYVSNAQQKSYQTKNLDAFNSTKDPELPSGTKSEELEEDGTSGNYQYELEIYTNLRR